jgi:uncharacterized damage-inducible protein DinB
MTEQELKGNLDQAEKNPEIIAREVTGLKKKSLDYKPSPNKWSIQEIVCHLADSEIVFAHRIRQALADKEPAFAPIDQDAWANHLGYNEASVPEMLALYALVRRSSIRLLRRINLSELEKSGFHPEYNRKVTLGEIVEALVKHGPNHLEQIVRLKARQAEPAGKMKVQ